MSGHLPHTIGPMERWDHIAWRYYGDASNYSGIVAANRDIFDPLEPVPAFLPVGVTIKIPVIDGTLRARPEDLPPWLR